MTSTKKPLILISGATATGKTDLAVDLALSLNHQGRSCEIINGDSLLFYRELSVGTAKPTVSEQKGIKHHLIDICSANEALNASDYCEAALPLLNEIHEKKAIPIIVGGSAFYIRALLKGMYASAEASEEEVKEAQAQLDEIEEKGSWSAIREKLLSVDPQSFERIHENDRYRTLRALEYYLIHETPISLQKDKLDEAGPYDFSRLRYPDWLLHHIYLEVPKEDHWPIMEKRAKKMLENGLLEEVFQIIGAGLTSDLKPLQSIGYKECFQAINKDSKDSQSDFTSQELMELSERIFINTRRLAKSQKTFFNKIEPKNSYNPLKDHARIKEDLKSFLEQNYG